MHFYKYQCLGNDLILLDRRGVADQEERRSSAWRSWVQWACDRHRGIGSDGLLILTHHHNLPTVEMFNIDGSSGEVCLNGVRAAACHLMKEQRLPTVSIRMNGTIYVAYEDAQIHLPRSSGEALPRAPVGSCAPQLPQKMGWEGMPYGGMSALLTLEIPTAAILNKRSVQCGGVEVEGIEVSVGNPHFVVRGEAYLSELERLGHAFNQHPAFPRGTNLEVMWKDAEDPQGWQLRIFERGCGITLSCGSGAAAAAAVLRMSGDLKDQEICRFYMLGGSLQTEHRGDVLRQTARVFMPFSGTWTDQSELLRGVQEPILAISCQN